MGTVTSGRPLEEWAGQRVYRAIESVTQRGSQRSGPAGAWLRCAHACLAWRQLAPLLTPPSYGLCFLRTSSLETICRTSSLGAICHGPCTARWRRCPMGTVTASRPLEEWAVQSVYRAIESVTQRGSQRSGPAGAWLRLSIRLSPLTCFDEKNRTNSCLCRFGVVAFFFFGCEFPYSLLYLEVCSFFL